VTTTPVADEAAVDHRDPEVRLRTLFDQGTLRLLSPADDSGALAARGLVDGTPVIAYATDVTGPAAAILQRAAVTLPQAAVVAIAVRLTWRNTDPADIDAAIASRTR